MHFENRKKYFCIYILYIAYIKHTQTYNDDLPGALCDGATHTKTRTHTQARTKSYITVGSFFVPVCYVNELYLEMYVQ